MTTEQSMAIKDACGTSVTSAASPKAAPTPGGVTVPGVLNMTQWRPSLQVRGEEIAGFDFNGSHYKCRRDPSSGCITYLSKRIRNRNSYTYGTAYQPLSMAGAAAKKLLAALASAGVKP